MPYLNNALTKSEYMDVAVQKEGRLGFASSCLQVDLVSHRVADRAARAEALLDVVAEVVVAARQVSEDRIKVAGLLDAVAANMTDKRMRVSNTHNTNMCDIGNRSGKRADAHRIDVS